MQQQLQRFGIHVDVVTAYSGESRTCTILCDTQAATHPTVINEETPQIESDACDKLLARVRRWIPKVEGVLTTGSLSTGLPDDLYARILDYARMKKKVTAIDAAGPVLRAGILCCPEFINPSQVEFFQ